MSDLKTLLEGKNLPEWAHWAAQDEDGSICVFEYKPNMNEDEDGGYWSCSDASGYCEYAIKRILKKKVDGDWRETCVAL